MVLGRSCIWALEQDPPNTPGGGQTIVSQNHPGVKQIVIKQIPPNYCGGKDNMYIYEEALYSFISLRTSIKRYLDEEYASRGISYNESSLLTVAQAFRTWPEQARMIRNHPDKAAPQGRSNHQGGLALDINGMQSKISGRTLLISGSGKLGASIYGPVFDWMQKNAWKFGWRRTVPSEIWHWEFRRSWIGVEYHSNGNGQFTKQLQYAAN